MTKLAETAFASLQALAGRSARWPSPSPLIEDTGATAGFQSLGIPEFFICPFDSADNQFKPPFEALMAVPEGRQTRDYVRSFAEVGSTARNAKEAFLEAVLLRLLLSIAGSGEKTSPTITAASLYAGLRQTLERVGQCSMLNGAGCTSAIDSADVWRLVSNLARELQATTGSSVLSLEGDICRVVGDAQSVSDFIPFRVIGLNERAAAVVWQSLYDAFCRLPRESVPTTPDEVPYGFYRNFQDRLRGNNRFWDRCGRRTDWSRVLQVLTECLPDGVRLRVDQCRGRCDRTVATEETVVGWLFEAVVGWATQERGVTDASSLSREIQSVQAFVLARIPARDAAARATGWSKLLVFPVIVERRLAGVFFGHLESDPRTLHQPDESKVLRTLIHTLAGSSLAAYFVQAQNDRREAILKAEHEGERRVARDLRHTLINLREAVEFAEKSGERTRLKFKRFLLQTRLSSAATRASEPGSFEHSLAYKKFVDELKTYEVEGYNFWLDVVDSVLDGDAILLPPAFCAVLGELLRNVEKRRAEVAIVRIESTDGLLWLTVRNHVSKRVSSRDISLANDREQPEPGPGKPLGIWNVKQMLLRMRGKWEFAASEHEFIAKVACPIKNKKKAART